MITESNTPTCKYGFQPPEKLKRTQEKTPEWYKLMAKLMVWGVIRFILILISNLSSIPAYLVFMAVIKPLRKYAEQVYWYIEGVLYRWLQYLVSYWMWSAGYSVVECGDEISDLVDDETILLVNHQSTSDVPVIMYTMQFYSHVLERILWIQDVLMKKTNFGFVSKVHEDFFIQQGKETRHLQPILLRQHLLEKYLPRKREWIVVFPEGGLFWKQRKASQEYGKKNGFPHLEHCALPRTGALHTILNVLNKETNVRPIKYIIDVTIGYPQGRPLNFQTIIAGQRDPIVSTLYYRKYPVSEVPLEEEALRDWMFKIYSEKDKMLETFYKTGRFLEGPDNHNELKCRNIPRRLELDYGMVIFVNVFFFCLTILELYTVYLIFRTVFAVLSFVF